MKKQFFLAMAFAAITVSCTTNDENSGLEALTSDASGAITSYVANNFPDTKIVSSVAGQGVVTTELNTGEELVFTTSGAFKAYSNHAADGLPADSLGIPCDSLRNDSIRPDHCGGGRPGEGHPGKGGRDGKGGKHGDQPGGKHGNDSINGGRHGHDRHFKNEIAIDSLAADINSYISTNYAGYVVLHAQTDTICEGPVTEVMVVLAAAQPVKLVFDPSGVFLFKGERFDYANVPAEVSAAITSGYSTFVPMKKCEKYTLADSSVKYKIHLRNQDVRKAVTVNADGSISCEK